jgi:hypothetical protein
MRCHVFALTALGAFPDGTAYRPSLDLVQALIQSGEPVVIQTGLSPRALPLVQNWLKAQAFPEELDVQSRTDDFPTAAASLPDYLGTWLKAWMRGRAVDDLRIYGGSLEELESCAAALGSSMAQLAFHHITPAAIYRIMP